MRFIRSKAGSCKASKALPALRTRALKGRREATEFSVNVWKDAVAPSAMSDLAAEAMLLWNFFGGSRSKAKSFWIERGARPRCLLEAFAQSVSAGHSPAKHCGAEFWVQFREGSVADAGNCGGLEFHFDKDEEALVSSDTWRHPALSTVTYLSTSSGVKRARRLGAPLVVFSTTSEDDSVPTRLRPRRLSYTSPQFSWTVLPVPGFHVTFDGSLLHGVPSELSPLLCSDATDSSFERLSFPVNVWTDCRPIGAQPLPDEFIREARMSQQQGSAALCAVRIPRKAKLNFSDITSNMEVDDKGVLRNGWCRGFLPSEDAWQRLSEHKAGDTAELPLRPLRQLLIDFQAGTGSEFPHGGLRVEYIPPGHYPVIVRPVQWFAHNF